MHADPAGDDFSLDDDLARIDDLLPLWQRFGPEEAEERRVAARFQFLELVSDSAANGAPNSAIERLLAVNLVVVQAAALNCLQRDPNSFGSEGHGYLRQGARLMELCLRLAGALAREQKSRRREAREAEVSAATPLDAEPPEAAEEPAEAASERPGARQPGRWTGHRMVAPDPMRRTAPTGTAHPAAPRRPMLDRGDPVGERRGPKQFQSDEQLYPI